MSNIDNETEDTKAIELEAKKWKYRRYMAFISLASAIIFTLLAIFGIPTERLNDLSFIIITSITGFFSLVGAYFGLTTWYDSRKK